MNRVVICLFAFLLGGSMLLAQLPTGTILGVVKDSSGAVVPGANVTARQTDTNQTRSAVTGENGAYRFDSLPVGNYEITVKANGFETLVQSGLILSVGQEAVSNITLQVGGVSQTVSVSAEASNLVSTTTSSLSSLVTPETIADMPLNGRNYNDLTLLQMGVTKAANSGVNTIGFSGTQFSSNGAPQRSNTYLLDGGLLMGLSGNSGASALGTTLGIDGIQEYRIITNNFDAEYGMTMGSQMLVASKGGTNAFHGDAFEFLRNSVFDARNYFDLPTSSVDLHGHRNPEFRRNQFGGSLGGPIQKDKTFFFVDYEGLRAYLGATETSTTLGTLANPNGCHTVTAGQIVTAAQCPQLGGTMTSGVLPQMIPFLALWPTPNIAGSSNGTANNYGWIFPQVTPENYGQVRIDHAFSGTDTLFGRWTIDQSSLPYLGNFNSNEAPEYSRNQFFTLAESHIFSASVVNSARFSITREPLVFGNTILDPRLLDPSYVMVPNPLGMGYLNPGGVSIIGNSNLSPREEFETISTYADDVSYNRGQHSFKFGFIFNHYPEKIETHGFDRGYLTFSNMATFYEGLSSSFSVTEPGYDDVTKYLHFDTMGFYAQDSWKVMPRLTLNLGMRYEPTTSVNEIHGNTSNIRNVLTDTGATVGNPVFKNPSLRNWSPRFGFAWDVFGDGKTAVRGGFDLLYDLSTLGSMYMIYAGYDPPFAQNYTTTNYSTNFGPMTVPLALPAIGSFTPTYRGPAYTQNQPHLMSYNLTLQRELPGQMALTVAYAGSKGLNLYRGEEGNNVLPSGLPTVDSAGKTICSVAPAGTVFNNANQYDGEATSCYAINTTTALQCGLKAGPNSPPGPGVPCYNRVNDAIPSIVLSHSDATSLYNALDVNLTKRVTHGLQFNAAYTWSRLLDNEESGVSQDGQIIAEEPLHPNSMWGPELFDVTNVFHFSGVYHLPDFTTSEGFVSKLTNGWMMNGILSLQSGYPFSLLFSSDHSNISWASGGYTSVQALPDVVPGRTAYNITHGTSTGCGTIAPGTPLGTPKLWYDPCAFSVPPAGFIGTEGRSFLRGPGLHNVDFSLVKDTAVGFLGEGGKIEFRAEVFDLFNHPNFALPSTTVAPGTCPAVAGDPNAAVEGCSLTNPLGTAGVISSTLTNPGALPGGQRQIQFGLKVMF